MTKPVQRWSVIGMEVFPYEAGKYVEYRAYAKLEAECKRLKEQNQKYREAVEEAYNDGEHASYCNAVKGPKDEGWLVEDECNCWKKLVKQVVRQVLEVKK